MPKQLLKLQNVDITSFDEYVVIQVYNNLMPNQAAEIEGTLTKETPTIPWIINCFKSDQVLPQDARIFLSLKKLNPKICLIVNPAYKVDLVQAGLATALPHALSLKLALTLVGLKYKPKIDTEFINPFLEAAIRVISMQAGVSAEAGKPFLVKEPIPSDICGIIPISSPIFTGVFSLEFKSETFLKMVSKVFGEEYLEINTEIEGFSAEMANMVYGAAKAKVNEKGYTLMPALPTTVRGAQLSSGTSQSPIAIGVPITCEMGTIHVVIRMDT